MSKAFQGQNDGAAPAQGYNQSVHDNPQHGKSATDAAAPKTPSFDKEQYEQQSVHQGGHSGLPVQPDGKLRPTSVAIPQKKGKK